MRECKDQRCEMFGTRIEGWTEGVGVVFLLVLISAEIWELRKLGSMEMLAVM